MSTAMNSTLDPEEELEQSKIAVLKIHGPDKKGIVAAFSQLLYGHGCVRDRLLFNCSLC